MGEDQQPAVQQEDQQDKWGDTITEARRAELQAILDAWNAPDANHGDLKGPFDGIKLTGADACWLAGQVRTINGDVRDLHLETLYVNTP